MRFTLLYMGMLALIFASIEAIIIYNNIFKENSYYSPKWSLLCFDLLVAIIAIGFYIAKSIDKKLPEDEE